MYFFTSIATNYLAKARVLCKTLKENNKDAKFIVMLVDNIPEKIKIEDELFDDIITLDQVKDIKNIDSFRFKYNVTEICTAVKPSVAKQIMFDYGAEKVVYIDPDIGVFNNLNQISILLDKYSMVFTPHQTMMEEHKQFIVGNEILFLKKGSMNLGFFAVKRDTEGIKFLDWWSKRLMEYTFDDNYEAYGLLKSEGLLGMFTDQKWIDLVPSFFDNYYILKNPGYNVSTWNLTTRTMSKDEKGSYFVDGEPLQFFHFSSFDSKHHHSVLNLVCEVNPKNKLVKELSAWYTRQLKLNDQEFFGAINNSNANYDNGEVITDIERKLYLIRKDIHDFFPNPYAVNEGNCYYNWVRGEYSEFFDERKNDNPIIVNRDRITKKQALAVLIPEHTIAYKIFRKIYKVFKKEKNECCTKKK